MNVDTAAEGLSYTVYLNGERTGREGGSKNRVGLLLRIENEEGRTQVGSVNSPTSGEELLDYLRCFGVWDALLVELESKGDGGVVVGEEDRARVTSVVYVGDRLSAVGVVVSSLVLLREGLAGGLEFKVPTVNLDWFAMRRGA